MHIISSLFIIISLTSIDCDAPEHYYIFVIDTVYCYIRIYVIFINMYNLSMKYITVQYILPYPPF